MCCEVKVKESCHSDMPYVLFFFVSSIERPQFLYFQVQTDHKCGLNHQIRSRLTVACCETYFLFPLVYDRPSCGGVSCFQSPLGSFRHLRATYIAFDTGRMATKFSIIDTYALVFAETALEVDETRFVSFFCHNGWKHDREWNAGDRDKWSADNE